MLMMHGDRPQFWVFRSKVPSRARVHIFDCVHCNNGRGHPNASATGESANTGWEGYPTLDDALESEAFSSATNRNFCRHCLRHA